MKRKARRLAIAGIVLAACTGIPAWAKSDDPPDYGAQPTWENFKEVGDRELRARLVDPESARIEWPYLAVQGSLKPFLRRTAHGYWTCGLVNARNRMGGYTGATFFLIMEKNGAVTSLDIGEVGGMDTATITCSDSLKKGTLPPAPAAVSQASPVSPPAGISGPKFGFGFMMVPQGAYVASIEPGGVAEMSGLKVGNVISAINAIPVAGMDQATVLSMLGALQSVKLTLAEQGEIELSRNAP